MTTLEDLSDSGKFLVDLKRNLDLGTTLTVNLRSGYADIPAANLRDCALKTLLVEMQERTNKLLSVYAHRVLRDTVADRIEELQALHEATPAAEVSELDQIISDYVVLSAILNKPLSDNESQSLVEGYIKEDLGSLDRFKDLEPEPAPIFLQGDFQLGDDGKTLVIVKK